MYIFKVRYSAQASVSGGVQMITDNSFLQAVQKNLGLLEQYVPVVARVHGASHNEFHQVRAIFDEIVDEIVDEIKKGDAGKADLAGRFESLRKITGNYTVPSDVCESYEAVYGMLSELDAAYSAG